MRFSDKSIIYMGSNFAGSLLQLVQGIILVRYLSKYDYGTFRQIMLISALVSSSLAMGLPQSLSYFIPRAPSSNEKKQYAVQVFNLLFLLGLGVGLVCFFFREELGRGMNNPDLVNFAWIFSVFFLFLIPSKCTQTALVALGQIMLASGLNVLVAVTNFSCVVIPLLLGWNLEKILLSMLTIYGMQLLLMLGVLLMLDGVCRKPLNWEMLKAQIHYSVPLWLSIVVGIFRGYVDQFLVAFLYRPENFAIYARGAFELPLVAIIPYTLSNLITPKFAEYYKDGDIPKIISLWQETTRKVAQLFFPLFIFFFILAEPIITLLFTMDYAGSVLIFRIYLCLLPIRLIAYRAILSAIGKTRPILGATILSMVASVVMGILLESRLGLPGPAIGILIGELLSAWFMLWHTKNLISVTWLDLIPIRKLSPPLSGAIITGILLFLLPHSGQLSIWVLGGYAIGYFGLYVAFMRIFRFFTEEDWALLCRWVTLEILRGHK